VSADPELLHRLARESGRFLGELGVRPEDSGWIRQHAETIESLTRRERRPGVFAKLRRLLLRVARKSR
jgi:hypothetical protein